MRSTKLVSCRKALLATAAAVAFGQGVTAWAAQGSAVQTSTSLERDEGGLTEIVVTAEKRETNLQHTPIAMSVLGSEDLKNRRIQSLTDLVGGTVPSLRIVPFFSRSSALIVGIRGIVPADPNQPSRDAGVGIYIDGVYLGRSQGLGMALLDVERIEVLKGPQGTLFGRNSTGGAVSITSRKPSGEFQLRQTVGVRNFGGYSGETHIDFPRFANLSLKVDGVLSKRGGTTKNPLGSADDFNTFDRRGIHGAALWEPNDGFSAQLDGDYSYDATTSYYIQLLEKNPAAPALAPLVQVQADRARTADIGVPQQPSIGRTYGVALNLNWTVDEDVKLRSISSYRHLTQSQFDNGLGAHSGPFIPNAAFSRYGLASLRQHQYSQELQLIGSAARLNYVAGLYYYHEAGEDNAWSPNSMRWNADGTVATPLPTLQAATPFPDRASNAKADSYAAFGQASWNPPVLNNVLHLTVGGRYTHDEKSGTLFKVNGAVTDFRFNISSDRFDPQVTLAADINRNAHLYGKWSTAYRAGGANARSINYRAFGPEHVEAWKQG
ncbi:TonB-dependent receptor [Sphingobium tyrosinilyticum]|uniref:TonB-dependent receptor n=1 Tax=Sphingobium tyrosinilyticum TaxID=2715436 RepID=A0ABV9F3Y2_9SPHN